MLASLNRARSLRPHVNSLAVRALSSSSTSSSQANSQTAHKQAFIPEELRERTNHEFKKVQKKVFTIPNILTFSRIATAPVIGYYIWTGSHTHALACFAFAATTDFLDGFLARRFNQQSDIGAMLDPIADKALMITCFVALYNTSVMPLWCIKAFVFRDLVILSMGSLLRYNGFNEKPSLKKFFDFKNHPTIGMEPTLTSKCNTALQCLLIVTHLSTNHLVGIPLYDWSIFGLQAVTTLTTIGSLAQYGVRFIISGANRGPPPRSKG